MSPKDLFLLFCAICLGCVLSSAAKAQDAEAFYNTFTGDVTLDFNNTDISLASVVTSQPILIPGNTDFGTALGAPTTNTTSDIGWDSGGAAGLPTGSHAVGPILNPGLDLVFENLGAAGSRSRVFDSMGTDLGFLALTYEISGSGTTNFVGFIVVPEPGSVALFGLVSFAAALRRRR